MLHNSIYLGVQYDARLEIDGWRLPGFNDSQWEPAVLAQSSQTPRGALRVQTVPPIRIHESFAPVSVNVVGP